MANMLASLLALLNLMSEELHANPGSAPLFAFGLRSREAKVGPQNAFRRVRLASLD